MIIPAHEPYTGIPAAIRSRSGPCSPNARTSLSIVVDSPPGITRPSTAATSSGRRTVVARAPLAARAARCSRTSPWTARTPMWGMPVTGDDATARLPTLRRVPPAPETVRAARRRPTCRCWSASSRRSSPTLGLPACGGRCPSPSRSFIVRPHRARRLGRRSAATAVVGHVALLAGRQPGGRPTGGAPEPGSRRSELAAVAVLFVDPDAAGPRRRQRPAGDGRRARPRHSAAPPCSTSSARARRAVAALPSGTAWQVGRRRRRPPVVAGRPPTRCCSWRCRLRLRPRRDDPRPAGGTGQGRATK